MLVLAPQNTIIPQHLRGKISITHGPMSPRTMISTKRYHYCTCNPNGGIYHAPWNFLAQSANQCHYCRSTTLLTAGYYTISVLAPCTKYLKNEAMFVRWWGGNSSRIFRYLLLDASAGIPWERDAVSPPFVCGNSMLRISSFSAKNDWYFMNFVRQSC